MTLRLDLLNAPGLIEEAKEEALATLHRYKPEPLFSRTGIGSLSPTSPEERASEETRSSARIRNLTQRSPQVGPNASIKA